MFHVDENLQSSNHKTSTGGGCRIVGGGRDRILGGNSTRLQATSVEKKWQGETLNMLIQIELKILEEIPENRG